MMRDVIQNLLPQDRLDFQVFERVSPLRVLGLRESLALTGKGEGTSGRWWGFEIEGRGYMVGGRRGVLWRREERGQGEDLCR